MHTGAYIASAMQSLPNRYGPPYLSRHSRDQPIGAFPRHVAPGANPDRLLQRNVEHLTCRVPRPESIVYGLLVAEHQRLSMVVAAELGYMLLKTPKGIFTLRCHIAEVLEHAKLTGNRDKAKHVDGVLTRFNAAHPPRRVL